MAQDFGFGPCRQPTLSLKKEKRKRKETVISWKGKSGQLPIIIKLCSKMPMF